MEIEAVRDWIIVIYGAVGIVVFFILLALMLVVYRKATSILDSTKETVDTMKSTTSMISSGVIKPFVKAQGLFAGIKKTIEVVSSLNNKGGDQKDGK